MSTFELLSQLSKRDQKKILKILAIDSASRTSAEASFLAARLPYQDNEIVRYGAKTDLADESGLILEAEGNSLPTGYSGFKVGAFFRDLDKTGNNLYLNTGTITSAVWSLVGFQVPSSSPSLSASLSPSLSESLSPSLSASS